MHPSQRYSKIAGYYEVTGREQGFLSINNVHRSIYRRENLIVLKVNYLSA